MRRVIYMAHPVSGDVHLNIARALRWLAWLRHDEPSVTYIAPWIAAVMSGEDDNDPAARAAGLADCLAVVTRCDAVVLVGGRVSSGMLLEQSRASDAGLAVIDLTHMGVEPPHELAFR